MHAQRGLCSVAGKWRCRLIACWCTFFSELGNFSTIFNPAEQYFGGVGCQVWAAEDVIDRFKSKGSGLAINIVELIQNIFNPHARVPSTSVGHVKNLESSIDTCIEGHEASALDVLHRHKVVLQSVEVCVDCGLFCTRHQWGVVYGSAHCNRANVDQCIAWVNWRAE
jgi:hypothetical protein